MKPKPLDTFTIRYTIWTQKLCRVVIWRNRASLLRARELYSGQNSNCQAFHFAPTTPLENPNILSEIHLYRGNLSLGTITHEATHAAVLFSNRLGLDTEPIAGEEVLAEMMEYLVEGIVFGVQKLRKHDEPPHKTIAAPAAVPKMLPVDVD